ncbi:pentapeptide repeat-containing protein [Actinokineospora soli]|uniref:Pentapeptide repeat-containing protein n=1 Tax=Actinokineospora soli TaxID=1048753 RepID=A0ABW2TSE0_9PSEU
MCCVALPFPKSADFAVDKPGGVACRNLLDDFRCGIHSRLRESGYTGCTVFECFGAGQRVSAGPDWRTPGVAAPMFARFAKVRELHELLWHLAEALALPDAAAVHDDLARVAAEVDAAADDPDADVDACRRVALGPLREASALARRGLRGPDLAGADLIGRDLRGRALRGASLRGALLVGADLRRVDLHRADLTGADLRGADLRGADLRGALFVTRPQLAAAVGDAATRLPATRERPAHWR